jgi:S-DNA-T family DNA segregation ATPase FtsK/SpoIIIE
LFFNKKSKASRGSSRGGNRRVSPNVEAPISPRFVRLLRESRWLFVVAALAFLTLILASYTRTDPGWSFSGATEALGNRGGIVGAWLADLLLYLFGASAWWLVAAGIVLIVNGYGRIAEPDRETDHPLLLGSIGFVMVLLASSAVEAIRLWRLPMQLPGAPGGAIGDLIGGSLMTTIGFNGATLALLAAFAVGFSLFTGLSWLRLMERIGAGLDAMIAWVRAKRDEREDRRIGEQSKLERDVLIERTREEEEWREPIVVVPPVAAVPRSERVVKEKQRPLFTEMPDSPLPPLSLLEDAPPASESVSAETLEFTSRLIERKLADFGVQVRVLAAYPGPVITRFEIEPAVGVKGAQIVNLVKDLARALSVISIRVVETIPGKSCMALELPNPKRQIVRLVEILSSTTYNDAPGRLTLALGKDIAGRPVVMDLAKMPHLLVAGTTGSGKSVAVNAMILSLLYKSEPREVRVILIDPKMLELSVYEGIPHLLAPVVTDMKLAPNALHWCVGEMERRYKLMTQLGVRNLAGYNQKIAEAKKAGKPLTHPAPLTPDAPEPLEEMPTIVVVIDELADLMMVTGKKIEELIARIAQKARAAGIHLVLATQRPSVDVITGLIKANIPSRIAFQVASKVDSRTILDQMGAEALLGQGDMLYLPPGSGYPMRVHGAFVSDAEVHRVVEHLKASGSPQYIDGILEGGSAEGSEEGVTLDGGDAEADPLYDQAVAVVLKTRRPSISLVQRHLRIGYNRSARLIEQMERAGLVSAMQANGNREVLVPVGKETQ